MLTSGMVPALYEETEKDGIVGNIRDEAVKKGTIDNKDALWQYYVGKCRDNLHVILAMSPVGETLRVRCRSFPCVRRDSNPCPSLLTPKHHSPCLC